MSNILNIGATGLAAAKKSLQTTGHNIANVNTEGYSRQRVSQHTNAPVFRGGVVTGTGVRVTGVHRIHDQFLAQRILDSNTEKNYYENLHDQLSQVENVFNEIETEGLTFVVNKFFNSFRELANQPENDVIRSVVRDNAQLVVKDFRRIHETLDGLSHDIDKGLEQEVHNMNSLMANIAYLNKKITSIEAVQDETGDFRDQRDLALKELSKSFKLSTYTEDDGSFVVQAHGIGTIINGAHYQELGARATSSKENSSEKDGSYEIYFASRPAKNITSSFKSGRVASFLRARNIDVEGLKDKVNTLAYNMANLVNAIHRRGYTSNKAADNIQAKAGQGNVIGQNTGVNLFKVPINEKEAAAYLDLSDEVKSDPNNIATALEPGKPADNRIAAAIAKLQHERVMEDGASTIEEFYLKSVGKIGVEVGKAEFDKRQAEAMLKQGETLRDRISGVSIDEEAANLVKFQKAFEASAKVMQTANDMFNTVLSIKT